MTAVLTTTMTLRIILGVRGSLAHGGTYSGVSSGGATQNTRSAAGNPSQAGIGSRVNTNGGIVNIGGGNVVSGNRSGAQTVSNSAGAQTYTIDEMRAKAERDWAVDGGSDADDKQSTYAVDRDDGRLGYHEKSTPLGEGNGDSRGDGIKVTIDRSVDLTQK
jgi:hypothetical protein